MRRQIERVGVRMDNLTHTLLGIGLANAGLSRRFGRGTVLTLAMASNLPDVDTIWGLLEGGDAFLYRRALTHSIFSIPVLAAVAASFLRLRYKHIPWKTLFGLCLLGMGVHVFFDLVNSFGVVLLYPISLERFELAWVFIIDLVLWGLLLAPLLLSRIPSSWTELERLSQVSLACVGLYIALCATGRAQAVGMLERLAREQRLHPEFSYVFPEALGPHRFRGVLKEEGEYRMYLLHLLTGQSKLKAIFPTEEHSPRVQAIRATEAACRLEWFFKAPVWRTVKAQRTALETASKDGLEGAPSGEAEVEVFDLRFQSLVIARKKPPFAVRFKVSEGSIEASGPLNSGSRLTWKRLCEP